MLNEVKKTRNKTQFIRRWFSDDYFDLYVWYHDNASIAGFQLCYDKPYNEHAFTWFDGQGTFHHKVDTGESHTGGHAMTDILVADGMVPKIKIMTEFSKRANNIDPAIFNLILEKLKE